MKKMIVYFHGYGSSKTSDKVSRLKKDPDFNVYSFNIDIDPEVAYAELIHNIDMALIEDLHNPEEVVFVGTSLGGWWASKMADLYKCKAVIINPSIFPETSLLKHGVSADICSKYHPLITNMNYKYFFARYDEVIDSKTFMEGLIDSGYDVTVDDKANHRFGGESFERVVEYIKAF